MKVAVRFGGELAMRHGPRREIDLPDGATVADALRALPVLPGVRVARAGRILDERDPLADGDALALVVPVAGG